jgi:hypothetical protein
MRAWRSFSVASFSACFLRCTLRLWKPVTKSLQANDDEKFNQALQKLNCEMK